MPDAWSAFVERIFPSALAGSRELADMIERRSNDGLGFEGREDICNLIGLGNLCDHLVLDGRYARFGQAMSAAMRGDLDVEFRDHHVDQHFAQRLRALWRGHPKFLSFLVEKLCGVQPGIASDLRFACGPP